MAKDLTETEKAIIYVKRIKELESIKFIVVNIDNVGDTEEEDTIVDKYVRADTMRNICITKNKDNTSHYVLVKNINYHEAMRLIEKLNKAVQDIISGEIEALKIKIKSSLEL